MIIYESRAHCLSQIAFMEKASPGLKGIKCPIFKVLDFLSKTAPRICPIFRMVVEDNGEHCLSWTSFLKSFWITHYRWLNIKRMVFGDFPPKLCYDGSIHACIGMPNRDMCEISDHQGCLEKCGLLGQIIFRLTLPFLAYLW